MITYTIDKGGIDQTEWRVSVPNAVFWGNTSENCVSITLTILAEIIDQVSKSALHPAFVYALHHEIDDGGNLIINLKVDYA